MKHRVPTIGPLLLGLSNATERVIRLYVVPLRGLFLQRAVGEPTVAVRFTSIFHTSPVMSTTSPQTTAERIDVAATHLATADRPMTTL